jgi:hypothetical protein
MLSHVFSATGQVVYALSLVLGVAGLIRAIAVQPALSSQEGAFVRAIKAQNAHHLQPGGEAAKGARPPTISRDYEEKVTRREWSLEEGAVRVDVTLKREGPPDGLLYQRPVVMVSVAGTKAIEVEGAESFPDNPVFLVQVAEMDPSNPQPEVILSSYTGGAHCCSDTNVMTSSADGKRWSDIEMGMFDGGPLEARDLDGDGRYEFATRDNAFLYTFGCYACSTAPLQILQLDKGKLVDVSAEPKFRPAQIDNLKHIIEWANDEADRNGFLAGYVGQKVLLGEGAEAWKLMLEHHDRESDWGLDWCKVKRDDMGKCPPGQAEMLKFPQALERFLGEAGYELKK